MKCSVEDLFTNCGASAISKCDLQLLDREQQLTTAHRKVCCTAIHRSPGCLICLQAIHTLPLPQDL